MSAIDFVRECENLRVLLLAKAEDMAKRSETSVGSKGFFQAGKAEAFAWAAQHLDELLMRTE